MYLPSALSKRVTLLCPVSFLVLKRFISMERFVSTLILICGPLFFCGLPAFLTVLVCVAHVLNVTFWWVSFLVQALLYLMSWRIVLIRTLDDTSRTTHRNDPIGTETLYVLVKASQS